MTTQKRDTLAATRTWSVGKRYRVTLTVPALLAGGVACASCEWDPALPERLNQRERRDYRKGLEAAMADLAKAPGEGGGPC